MHFKEWLHKNETAGDSWFDPTAEPVARIYARYNGSAIDGIMLPNELPIDHARQEKAKEQLYNKLKNMHKKYRDSDKVTGDIWNQMEKNYLKKKPKLPRPQEFKDAPDQYTTVGWDSVGEPDTGQRTFFKSLPMYRI